jgi:hypothetical protein
MAVLNPQNLVLRGVRVEIGVANVRPGIGVDAAKGQTSNLSPRRHPSPSFSEHDYQPRKLSMPAGLTGLETTAQRAGRSGSSLGVCPSRGPARNTSPAIRLRWQLVAGREVCAMPMGLAVKLAPCMLGRAFRELPAAKPAVRSALASARGKAAR